MVHILTGIRLTKLLLAFLSLAITCFPQVNTGRIIGIVHDPSGASVPKVPVRATNEETGVVTNTVSQETGDYLINFLIPGTYRVDVEQTGFQKSAYTGVVVNAGGISRIDVSLRIGETRQQVEVAASTIVVATETSELSQNFTNKELDNLPNIDRNPLFQMNLMPGANNGRGSGGYGNLGGENPTALGNSRDQLASLGGVSANANSVFIEGTFNREPQNATVSVLPSIEGIEEVQIYTGQIQRGIRILRQRRCERDNQIGARTSFTAPCLSTCATRRQMRGRSSPSPRHPFAATSSAARSVGRSRKTSCSSSATTRARCSARPEPASSRRLHRK